MFSVKLDTDAAIPLRSQRVIFPGPSTHPAPSPVEGLLRYLAYFLSHTAKAGHMMSLAVAVP